MLLNGTPVIQWYNERNTTELTFSESDISEFNSIILKHSTIVQVIEWDINGLSQ